MKMGMIASLIALSALSSLQAQTRTVNSVYDQLWTASGGTTSQITTDLDRGFNTASYSIKSLTGKTYTISTPTYRYNSYTSTSSWDGMLNSWLYDSGLIVGHSNDCPANGVTNSAPGRKIIISNYPYSTLSNPKVNWVNASVVKHEAGHVYGAPDHYVSYPWQAHYSCQMNKNLVGVITNYNIEFCSTCVTTIQANKDQNF